MTDSYSPAQLLQHVQRSVVGMQREAELISVALHTGRHVVLEGPPGTGKSTVLRALADAAGLRLYFVEGNAELTPGRLVGHHDPAMVMRSGYTPDTFVPGPLVDALRDGGMLYLEELNRIPEESLNVLITALAEGEVHVPRVGRIPAHPTFRLIAAMNPVDSVGTTRIAQAIYDRLCRVAIGYQDETNELRIVTQATDTVNGGGMPPTVAMLTISVLITRLTRNHKDLRSGSSVRGAIDMSLLGNGLLQLRHQANALDVVHHRGVLVDSAIAALSGRVRVDESCDRSAETIIEELLDAAVAEWLRRQQPPDPGDDSPRSQESDQGKADGSGGAPQQGAGRGRILSGDEAEKAVHEAGRRTHSRSELSRMPNFNQASPEVGQVDAAAIESLFESDPDAAMELLANMANATDRPLRALARKLAAQLVIRVARDDRQPARGVQRIRSQTGLIDGDIDLDGTLGRTAGLLPTSVDDVVVRAWSAGRRAICLLVDRSGSMSGHQVALAALGAAGVLLAGDERTETSVLAFNKDVVTLQHQGQPRSATRIIDDLLTLRGHGETDLSLAFSAARRELDRTAVRERVVVVLSDAQHTTGLNPELALRGIDRLHVVGTSSKDEAVSRGKALAAAGRGQYRLAESVGELPKVLNGLLNSRS